VTSERSVGAARWNIERRIYMYWIIAFLIGVVLAIGGCVKRTVRTHGKVDKRDEEILIASVMTTWIGS
jgi:hypothetical protein